MHRFTLAVLLTIAAAFPEQSLSQSTALQRDWPGYRWEAGLIVAGGFAPNYKIKGLYDYQEELLNFTGGAEAGLLIGATHGPAPLRGRGEVVIEVLPLWINYEPRQRDSVTNYYKSSATFAGYHGYGAAVVPALYRWNFTDGISPRIVPWLELGAGILWTARQFPQGYVYAPGGNTSTINFLPQIAGGGDLFTRGNQSIELGAKYTPITNAGLGQYNPGVTILQFSVAYKWWKKRH